ncbi:MAG: hypothetical protein IKV58_00595 [Oscillospiraceae bacterium]|nr:hypothetical protein [Oscillospiraceae bacterium]
MASKRFEDEELNRDSIDRYRKKQKRKKRSRALWRFLLTIILLLIVVYAGLKISDSGFNISDFFSEKVETVQEGENYPIKFLGSKGLALENTPTGNVLLTTNDVFLYSKDGDLKNSYNHGYVTPILKTSSKYALVFDQSANRFALCSPSGVEYEKTILEQVITADVNSNGSVAVAITNERSGGNLVVYDHKGNEKARWDSSDKQITSVSFKSGGTVLVGCLSTDGGDVVTTIVGVNAANGKAKYSYNIKGKLMLELAPKSLSKAGLIFDNGCGFYNSKGEDVNSTTQTQKLLCYDNSNSGGIVMAFEHYSDADISQIMMYKSDGDAIKADVEGVVRDIIYKGSKIYALHANKISVFDEDLALVTDYPISANVQKIAVSGNMAYLLKPTLIEAFSLS